jgi:hypothetical protein
MIKATYKFENREVANRVNTIIKNEMAKGTTLSHIIQDEHSYVVQGNFGNVLRAVWQRLLWAFFGVFFCFVLAVCIALITDDRPEEKEVGGEEPLVQKEEYPPGYPERLKRKVHVKVGYPNEH